MNVLQVLLPSGPGARIHHLTELLDVMNELVDRRERVLGRRDEA
jgi:hypothetical protein